MKQILMTAVKTPATMEELAETWSMTSSVNVKMGGKEKLATLVTASVMRQHAIMEEHVMMRGTLSSACVLQDGKEPLVI